MADTLNSVDVERISALERCVPEIQKQIAVLDSKADSTIMLVREIRDDQKNSAKQSTDLVIAQAQNIQRWEVYERERAKFDERLEEIEELARSNQLTIAKTVAIGGGGGVLGILSVEILKFLIERL